MLMDALGFEVSSCGIIFFHLLLAEYGSSHHPDNKDGSKTATLPYSIHLANIVAFLIIKHSGGAYKELFLK